MILLLWTLTVSVTVSHFFPVIRCPRKFAPPPILPPPGPNFLGNLAPITMDLKQFCARAMHVNVSILWPYLSFNAGTLVYKQFQVDFEILKVIFNKNFTSHIVSANSVYNGDNNLYLTNSLSLCVCPTNTTNSIVNHMCMYVIRRTGYFTA